MARSDVERLMEAIDPIGYHTKDRDASCVRALLRAAELMRHVTTGDEEDRACKAYDRAKARILGEKSNG